MATRSERFRARVERMGPPRPKQPKRPRRDVPVDTAQPGISATDRKAGGGSTAARNRSRAAARKAAYVLEDSDHQPSRKSTRRARNRQKADSSLERRQTMRSTSPPERARRG
jgi:hypothetical protein